MAGISPHGISPLNSARPLPGKIASFNGKLSAFSAGQRDVAAAPEYVADDYPREMTWSEFTLGYDRRDRQVAPQLNGAMVQS